MDIRNGAARDVARSAEQEEERNAALSELVGLSNRYGGDARYVLAGGGNSSWKDDGALYIKSSGTSLATIKAAGFVGMDRKKLTVLMTKEYDRSDDAKREADVLADMMDSRLPCSESLRPSVETLLHNLFPHKFVLHLHPALVNGATCGARGAEILRELFGERIVWVPEYKPGYELAKLCERLTVEFQNKCGAPPDIIFLQNHGVFVAADDVAGLDAAYAEIMDKLESRATFKPVGKSEIYHVAAGGNFNGGSSGNAESTGRSGNTDDERRGNVGRATAAKIIAEALHTLPEPPAFISLIYNGDIDETLESSESFKPLDGAFTPDHIVYCKAYFLYVGGRDAAECASALPGLYSEFTAKRSYAPRVICVRGVGAFICASTSREIENAVTLFGDAVAVAVYSKNFGGPRHLSADLTDFITNWEIESYRQKVAQQ